MSGLSLECYDSETKQIKEQETYNWTPPPCEENPHPKGTTKYYQTKKRLLQKTFIEAKLFLSTNIQRLEHAMEEDHIKEQDYITTMDTMMLIQRIVIPQQEQSLAILNIINKPLTEYEIRTIEYSQRMFNILWLGIPSGRASDYDPESETNNFFNIITIASYWHYLQHMKQKNMKQKESPMVMSFTEKSIETYKGALSKWEREIQQPVFEIIRKYK